MANKAKKRLKEFYSLKLGTVTVREFNSLVKANKAVEQLIAIRGEGDGVPLITLWSHNLEYGGKTQLAEY